jgi:hypothetical protein
VGVTHEGYEDPPYQQLVIEGRTVNDPVPPEAKNVEGADVDDNEMLHPGAFSTAITVGLAAIPLMVTVKIVVSTEPPEFGAAVSVTAWEELELVPEAGDGVSHVAPVETLHVHPVPTKDRFRVPVPPDGSIK